MLEQHDVGALARDQLVRVAAPGRRPDGHHPRLGAEEHDEPRADGGLGVDHGDAGHGGNPLSAPSTRSKPAPRTPVRLPAHEKDSRGGRARRAPDRAVTPPPRRAATRPRSGAPRAGCRTSRRATTARSASVTRTRTRRTRSAASPTSSRPWTRSARATSGPTRATATSAARRTTSPRTSSSSASRTRASSSGSSKRRFPHGPGKDVRATVRGFAAGWNAYLRRTGVDNLPDPRCRGAAWVKPIRPIDLYRRIYQLGLRAVGRRAAGGDGQRRAARRRGGGRAPTGRSTTSAGMGSNGYAIGADGARDANALLLSNTHFPSEQRHALVRAAPDDPGQDRRDRRRAAGRPGRQPRLQPPHRLDAHGLDRAALRRLRAEARAGRPDVLRRRRQDGRRCAGAPCTWGPLAHVLRDALGPGRRAPGRDARLDGRDRLRARGPQRAATSA